MNIAVIGSTSFKKKMETHKAQLEAEGHKVKIPAFDDCEFNELEMCRHNKNLIIWANEVHVFWDGRSTGTIFDFGMTFAFNKPLKMIYLEPKSFVNLFRQYENFHFKRNNKNEKDIDNLDANIISINTNSSAVL